MIQSTKGSVKDENFLLFCSVNSFLPFFVEERPLLVYTKEERERVAKMKRNKINLADSDLKEDKFFVEQK